MLSRQLHCRRCMTSPIQVCTVHTRQWQDQSIFQRTRNESCFLNSERTVQNAHRIALDFDTFVVLFPPLSNAENANLCFVKRHANTEQVLELQYPKSIMKPYHATSNASTSEKYFFDALAQSRRLCPWLAVQSWSFPERLRFLHSLE